MSNKDRYRPETWARMLAKQRVKYAADPEKKQAQNRAWAAANPERRAAICREWEKKHPEGKRLRNRRWQKLNAGWWAAQNKIRKLKKKHAIPAWANLDAIKEIYKKGALLWMDVDHIVPINSPLVCGLHVENNLQLLTAAENIAKSNVVWPDMP